MKPLINHFKEQYKDSKWKLAIAVISTCIIGSAISGSVGGVLIFSSIGVIWHAMSYLLRNNP